MHYPTIREFGSILVHITSSERSQSRKQPTWNIYIYTGIYKW